MNGSGLHKKRNVREKIGKYRRKKLPAIIVRGVFKAEELSFGKKK